MAHNTSIYLTIYGLIYRYKTSVNIYNTDCKFTEQCVRIKSSHTSQLLQCSLVVRSSHRPSFVSGMGADGGRLGNKAICAVCQTIVLIRTSLTWMEIV